ncbi:MAG TPA: TetR/AcrR family transcriptional regulator [Xanthobacteraceae bacterium]|nr:TetR/AcrR family transcriptional regulator [Xanthobacteraceae bacterium]
MRVTREQAAANRERIIETAGELFRSKGFSGIGVADIMEAADLTHGGFYGHFASKDDLIAQASRRSMQRTEQNWRKVVAESGGDAFPTLLTRYLSPRHRDDPGHGCAFAALSGDAARCGKPVREAFAEGLEPLIDILSGLVGGRTKAARRRKAIAALSELIGALMLSRAVGDAGLSDEILDAGRHELRANVNQLRPPRRTGVS